MKFIIIAGWILASVDADGLILNDNGKKCLVDCSLEPNKIGSFDTECRRYLQCTSFGIKTESCYGNTKFDEHLKKCIPKDGEESPVCHPCAGYPAYDMIADILGLDYPLRTELDCPIDCRVNKGKKMSGSFDCKVYVECIDEMQRIIRNCLGGQKFSDDIGECVDTAEGSPPTCHPCRLSEIPVASKNPSNESPPVPDKSCSIPVHNSGVHEAFELTKIMILILFAMITSF